MKDLIEFKNAQIDALQKEIAELKEKNIQLGTWVYELTDGETPNDYKAVIRKEFTYNYY